MTRLSPITLGLAALMIAIVAAGVLLLAARRQPARPGATAERGEAPLPPPLATAAAPPRPIKALPPPPSPASPPAEPDPAPAVAPAAAIDVALAADAPPADQAPSRQRAALIANHNRRLGEADEQAFEALHVTDSTRASIRQINDDYRRRTEPASQASEPPGGGDVAAISAALKTRQDALRLLLGETPSREFDVEERAAVRRLRGKYRFEWGRQLRP